MKRNSSKTSISQIADYWSEIVDEGDLSVDWAEAEERCWRCGSAKELTRYHIIPHSLGGRDEPANYVILCRHCHEEGPNVGDPEIMWDWLMAYKRTCYDTFWLVEGIREYEHIYQRAVSEDPPIRPGTHKPFIYLGKLRICNKVSLLMRSNTHKGERWSQRPNRRRD